MPLLSDYQRAALDVMGIPVWVSQSDASSLSQTEAGSDHMSAAPAAVSSGDRAAKLAALRAQVSGDNASASAAQKPSLSNEAAPKPLTRSLTAMEIKAAGMLLNDIQLAAVSVNYTGHTLAFEIGEQLSITPGRITLPCAPAALSVSDKRALWKALSQA